MKKLVFVLLAAALATAACGGKKKEATTPTAKEAAPMGGSTYGGEGYGNPCGAMSDPCGGGE